MNVIEDNAALARRWFGQMWNTRDESLLVELMAPDCTGEAEGGKMDSRDEFVARVFRVLLAAFPDLRIEVIGTIAERDEVVTRWRATGTHQGDSLGIPATGLKVDFRGMSWVRFRNGQIVEGSDSWNQTGLMQALQTRGTCGTVHVVP